MATAHEQLQVLQDRVPDDAQPTIARWLKAIEANESITTLKIKSKNCHDECVRLLSEQQNIAEELSAINAIIQAA